MWSRSERRKMRGIRPAAVAGLFYPGEPGPLRRLVDSLLGGAAAEEAAAVPKANKAPHPG